MAASRIRRRFFYLSRFAKNDQNVSVKIFKLQCANNDNFITTSLLPSYDYSTSTILTTVSMFEASLSKTKF